MKKRHAKTLQAVVTLCLLAFVLYKVDLHTKAGWEQIALLFSGVSYPLFVASLAVGLILNLSSAWKWWWLVRQHFRGCGFGYILRVYYVAKFYNLFLPTSVGGDVYRIYSLGKQIDSAVEATATVVVDRVTGLVTLIVLCVVSVLFGVGEFGRVVVFSSIFAGIVLVGVFLWLLVGERSPIVIEATIGRLTWMRRVLEKYEETRRAIGAYRDRSIMRGAILFSLLFYLLAILNVYVTAMVFTSEVPSPTLGVAVPLIMMIMNMPISIGGIGLMESAYTFVFDGIGLGALLGISTALLMRLKTVIDAIIGGILHLIWREA